MKTPQEALYLGAPCTDREALTLVGLHGFGVSADSIDRFAASIPDGGQVIDVGAGMSTLGTAICAKRDDIKWVNFDAAYDNEALRFPMWNKPDNLERVGGDVLDLPNVLANRRFDRVLSYFLLPHILLSGDKNGATAARNILGLASEGGNISIGPTRTSPRNFFRIDRCLHFDAPLSEEQLESQTQEIVSRLRLNMPIAISWRQKNKQRYRKRLAGESAF